MTHSPAYRRILHKMKYYDYQQGLIQHHLNQEGGWDSHLKHCRDFILRALDLYKPSRITVLGSGWLLDLPLSEMIEIADNVCLVDIIHPPEVISQVSGLKKIELIEQDITGGLIKEVWEKTRKHTFLNRLKTLDTIFIPRYKPDGDPGMVLSLNILTQIESLPVKFISKHAKIDDDTFKCFSAAIQKKHIDFLKEHPSVLITDISEIITNQAGEVTEKQTLLTDLPEPELKEEWTWDFELVSSDYYRTKSAFRVMAISFCQFNKD